MKLDQKAMPALCAYAKENQVPQSEMGEDELRFLYDMSVSCGPNFNEAERAEYMKFRTDLVIGVSSIVELIENGVTEIDGEVLRLHGDVMCDAGPWCDLSNAARRKGDEVK